MSQLSENVFNGTELIRGRIHHYSVHLTPIHTLTICWPMYSSDQCKKCRRYGKDNEDVVMMSATARHAKKATAALSTSGSSSTLTTESLSRVDLLRISCTSIH